MALSPLPKLAATLVALLLIDYHHSSREMPTSLKEVGYLGSKTIIEDGKILVVKPEPKLVKPVIKEVTDEQPLKCIPKGYACGFLYECCPPYTCHLAGLGLSSLVMKQVPFPYGVILHSFLGSAEMVPELAKLAPSSRSLGSAPDRILLETDAPDAVLRCNLDSLFLVEGDPSLPPELKALGENPQSRATYALSNVVKDESKLPKELLNHPANIQMYSPTLHPCWR
ncbi:hypothetical protein Cgig2_003347 [Carnegiea gigantea]|uniref:Uncharacterized protein n=1 Tax=Carnegiea gigantea TaxID=171969 RepID=A0A9Q1QAD9_9CARY|nr:hypothetical protein Cgig2_003347 [Carnegiea gigantea]